MDLHVGHLGGHLGGSWGSGSSCWALGKEAGVVGLHVHWDLHARHLGGRLGCWEWIFMLGTSGFHVGGLGGRLG